MFYNKIHRIRIKVLKRKKKELEDIIAELKGTLENIKASLREKEVLFQEINHRVKNNLQIISSLLRLQARHIKDEKALEMFRESQYRIKSIALVHEMLYKKSQNMSRIDFNDYVKSLANNLFKTYGVEPEKISLKTEIEEKSLGIDLAVPCGLIINELVSNALKYAFPPSYKGNAQIEISLQSTDDNMIELIVCDNGVGIPKDLDICITESLGLHLVTILTTEQLMGEISLDREGGTRFHIRFKDSSFQI